MLQIGIWKFDSFTPNYRSIESDKISNLVDKVNNNDNNHDADKHCNDNHGRENNLI